LNERLGFGENIWSQLKMRIMKYIMLIIILIPLLFNCRNKSTPKPRGFFRIGFPDKTYQTVNKDLPYKFQIPSYAEIEFDPENPGKQNWINISIPKNKADIHISYYSMNNDSVFEPTMLAMFIEESRKLAYKHSIRASGIEEQMFLNPEKNVFGTVYKIKGNAASPMQFYLTDSINHFLRGALYIRATPDIDSLKPVIGFLEKDVIRIIETTSWN
jgi:gliding motility-associated lipoprotein GldD